MKYHIPLKGGRVVKVGYKKVVAPRGGTMNMMRGSGNLQRLKDALEKLQIKSKKYVKF